MASGSLRFNSVGLALALFASPCALAVKHTAPNSPPKTNDGDQVVVAKWPGAVKSDQVSGLLRSSVQNDIPDGFIVQNLTLVTMPQRPSDESAKISLCYAFVAKGLVDQLRCRLGKVDCTSEKDSVSLLDLSLVADGGAFTDVGPSLDDSLRQISGHQIAKESCMPFSTNPLFQSSNVSRTDPWQKLLWAQEPVNSSLEIRTSMVILNWPSKIEPSKVAEALNEQDPHLFLAKLIEDPVCRSAGPVIPKFNVEPFRTASEKPEDYWAAKLKIKSYIARGIPVGWSFCMRSWGSVCSEGHVVLIRGSRELCRLDVKTQSQTCEDQFLVRDSAVYINDRPGDWWVGDDVFAAKNVDSVRISRDNVDYPQFTVIESTVNPMGHRGSL